MNQQTSQARGRQGGTAKPGEQAARQQRTEAARIARTFYRPRFTVSIPESYPSFVPGYN